MAEQVDAEVKGIFEEALRRYKKGEQTYGVFDKDNDPRDLLKEAEEEMLDVMVYMAFEIARARGLRSRLDSVHALLSKRLTGTCKNNIESFIESTNGAPSKFTQWVSSPDLEGLRVDSSEELHYEPLVEKKER